MRILVTGSAGFLGYHLARRFAGDTNNHVTCVDNGIRGEFDEPYLDLIRRSNVTHVTSDLNLLDEVKLLPDEIDEIYHLAALNGTQNFYERPFEVVKCCTLPTINLLTKYSSSRDLRRFVYAGTSESYASVVTRFGWPVPTAEDVPLGIDDVLNPRWSYAAGKLHGEIATVWACKQSSKAFTIIRYHNVYGPRMGDKHVVPDFYIRARSGILALYGHEETRSFIYVDDAVHATILAGQSERTQNEIVNIGSEREVTIGQLGGIMKSVARLEGEIELHPSPAGSVRRRCPDVAKLKRLTGFAETWTLEQGLRATSDYYLKNDVTTVIT